MKLTDVFLDVLAGSGEADLRLVFKAEGQVTYTATFFQASTRQEAADVLSILAAELRSDESDDS